VVVVVVAMFVSFIVRFDVALLFSGVGGGGDSSAISRIVATTRGEK
jgi:hypothetical protein